MLSKEAKKLISKHPELAKEIAVEFAQCSDIATPRSKHNYWTDFVQNNKPNTCPHCGIPTDRTGNEQCWKAPKPLFVTEDGVELGKDFLNSGKELYVVWLSDLSWNTIKFFKYGLDTPNFYAIISNRDGGYAKYFSTKEGAEEYILLNKPCLSYSDILAEWSMDKDARESLIELIKKKSTPHI